VELGQTDVAARPIAQRLAILLLVLFVHALMHAATAAEIAGRVVSISDGDTLTILDQSQRQTRIRLAEIDTPESHQPYGSRAKQALSDLAFGARRQSGWKRASIWMDDAGVGRRLGVVRP
jgi:endonuclease YncB( thermonuclease family)